jgi:UV DNA damage repair endonuclease
MGVVYKATHLALDRVVALKLIAPEISGDEQFRERFKQESMTAAALDNSNVVPIYDAGEEHGQLYVTMRHVPGTDLRALIERGLAAAGEAARAGGVRLSMHPSQFCVIASASDAALQNGVAEFEYHAEVMTRLGYGTGWHPDGAHINIHAGAKALGAGGFRRGLARLSATARNLITVENDEVSYGLDDLLPLAEDLPIVLDLHHHWIASRGEYIEPDDPRIARIAASWRGVRPISHVSVSREELLTGHDIRLRPDFAALVRSGIKPRDLRAHSDLMWNEAVNDLVADHLVWTDFEVEAKFKNIASEGLAQHVLARDTAELHRVDVARGAAWRAGSG